MYIKEYEYINIVFESKYQISRWSKKLNIDIKENEEVKIHWSLLKTSTYRTKSIKVLCDDCGKIHTRRIRDLNFEDNYHLCSECRFKGERCIFYGKEKTQLQLDSVKKAMEENGNPFTWESSKKKIREKNPWKKAAEKNRGQKRSIEVREKMSNSALLAFKEGRRKPTIRWGNTKIKQYKDIDYQSTYELKFIKYLESLEKINLIERGPKIPYISTDGKEHNYFIDYKLKNTNIVIEIKSSYFWKKNEDINILKKIESEKHYTYVLIIDNNFKEITKILENYG